jgi:asparagine synthase (glutamine-hydrolysing)
MCGISVIVQKSQEPVSETLIRKMNNLVVHRGPDGEGYFHHMNLAMGHRRLKIIDLSNSAAQPMEYDGITITYNGEIYNYIEIRKQLSDEGYIFHTHSDTEVILAAYKKWGRACVQYFFGMWSFAIFDPNKNILFCSRDRFGIKPFCYFNSKDHFCIASEIKQFTAIPSFEPYLNHQAAFQFLYHSSIQGEEKSFFQHVKFLAPGQNLVYDLYAHTIELENWYQINQEDNYTDITYTEACKHFRKLFDRSISMHVRSDVEVGACLSGGLDSSSIVYSYKSQFPDSNPLRTVSSCFEEKAINEIEFIDYVVNDIQFPGNKIFPDIREIMQNNLFEKICYHQDQPITSGSFFSEYKVFEKAGELGLKVMLDGQGADEYLAGYDEFNAIYLNQILHKLKIISFTREALGIARFKDHHPLNFISNFGSNMFMNTGRMAMKKFNNSYFRPLWMNEKWFEEHSYNQNPYPLLLPGGIKGIQELTRKALSHYSLPHQLHSEDRNSMMHSIESRLPFLDHTLVEFVLNLPDNFKIRNGVNKSILRDGLFDILPNKISGRKNKLGFPGPEDNLFLRPDPAIRKILLELHDNFPGIFSRNILDKYERCFTFKEQNQNLIFKSLSFYYWTKAFNIKA